jgi:hypothetical protein
MEEGLLSKQTLSHGEVNEVITSYHHFDHHAAVGACETTLTG